MPWDSQYWPSLISFTIFYIALLVTPGPDCAITIRHSLGYSRLTGLASVIGTVTAMGLHVTYALLGLSLLIAESYWGFTITQYAGSYFLVYLGISSLRAKSRLVDIKNTNLGSLQLKKKLNLTPGKAFRLAFITDALNPMVLIFFISIFATIVDSTTPISIQISYALIVIISGLLWFSLISLTFSSKRTRVLFGRYIHLIEKSTGIVLIILAVNLILSDNPCIK